MFRVRPAAMPGNPAANKIGDKSGLWRVEIIDDATGQTRYEHENVTYDEAFQKSGELDNILNSRN